MLLSCCTDRLRCLGEVLGGSAGCTIASILFRGLISIIDHLSAATTGVTIVPGIARLLSAWPLGLGATLIQFGGVNQNGWCRPINFDPADPTHDLPTHELQHDTMNAMLICRGRATHRWRADIVALTLLSLAPHSEFKRSPSNQNDSIWKPKCDWKQ